MMENTLDKLKNLSDYCDGATTEDKDTELFEESVSTVANELWEIGILINKLKRDKTTS